ncbi:MAG: ATP-binding protein [Acidobacteriota bacterium]
MSDLQDVPVASPRHPRRRLGLRSETLILLPVATLVLVALSAFTLLSFRSALHQEVDERRQEAMRGARDLAAAVARDPHQSAELLRDASRFVAGAAIGDARGAVEIKGGDFQDSNVLTPLDGKFPETPAAAGPSEYLPGSVAGFASLGPAGARRVVRVDLAAVSLGAQKRGLAVLSWVVVVVGLAFATLVMFFLRYAVQPYDALLARARSVSAPGDRDEIEFLVQTFDRALHSLAQQGEKAGEDDIAALQRALAPSLESGLLLLDQDGGMLALNATGERILGTPASPAGTSVSTALTRYPALLGIILAAIQTGVGVQRAECSIEHPQGEPGMARDRALGLTVHPLRRDDGGIRGFLILFADLTDARRRDGESRLAESLARIGELAAGVAHELRNSLATLRGYLTLIERRPGEETVEDYLGEIRHETEHLQRVLEDFLAFARPGSARLEDVDLQAVVRRAVTDPALGGAAIGLDLQVPAGAILRGDAQLLERAVRNLLHNAVQAEATTPSLCQVAVRVQRSLEGLELEVSDRGPGLPPAIREQLFHPFVSGRPGGVGLGLALTLRIVDLHGGRIRIEDRVGGGARAILTFPILEQQTLTHPSLLVTTSKS